MRLIFLDVMKRLRSLVVLLALALPLAQAAAQAAAQASGQPSDARAVPAPSQCVAPPAIIASDEHLPEVSKQLRAGGSLDVLAIGSATMLGPRGSVEDSFPYRIVSALREAVPGASVQLTVHSGRGLTASDMLATLRAELASHRYQLVLWQTGTVEAVRRLPPAEFLKTLAEGVALVHDSGGEMVLIGPPYSRFLKANADLDPYLKTLQQVAELPGVIQFHRFTLMQNWVDTGQLDLERAVKSDREKTSDLLHACLGRALAQLVLSGTVLTAP